jgi:hypothetical protein
MHFHKPPLPYKWNTVWPFHVLLRVRRTFGKRCIHKPTSRSFRFHPADLENNWKPVEVNPQGAPWQQYLYDECYGNQPFQDFNEPYAALSNCVRPVVLGN